MLTLIGMLTVNHVMVFTMHIASVFSTIGPFVLMCLMATLLTVLVFMVVVFFAFSCCWGWCFGRWGWSWFVCNQSSAS
jgi:membrane-associated HD superfamily phosphohydrolase